MAEQSFEEKTEKPTPQRRQEARKKGEVAKSRELPSVAVLMAGIVTLTLFGSYMYNHIYKIISDSFTFMPLNGFDLHEFLGFAQRIIASLLATVAPLAAAVFVAALLANVAQIGFMLSGEPIKPKFSKLNPIKGFGRIISKQSLMELLKAMFKLAIIGTIAYWTIKSELDSIMVLWDTSLTSISAYIMGTMFKLFFRCALAMLFLVALDYAFQKWEFEKKLRMSKKEVKDEFKRTEGDPLVKNRIKSIQMQMARKRMMQAVPEADVVITNPTHLAVALKYDSRSMKAPKLLAKGAAKLAQRIRAEAEKHGVPVVQNEKLAQTLYYNVEDGQEIPVSLYQAVAEVLAYVYGLKNAGLQRNRGRRE